jgi:hypothetical protein
MDYIWEIRNPDGAAMGMEFALGRSGEHPIMLAHALPERADITVRDDEGRLVASGRDLRGEGPTPIARLTVAEGAVSRENVWPAETDLGLPVILAGGEIGILTAWWNADDHRSWRWSIELSNHS